MTAAGKSPYGNRVLAGLTADDLALLRPHLVPIELSMRFKLETANRAIDHLYFLEQGVASIVAQAQRGRIQAEVGMVGRDGFTGVSLLHGSDRSPNDTFMQVAGNGHAIEADKLPALLLQSRTLERRLLLFAHAQSVQAGQTVVANARGSIEQRLARWLLMTHDRLRVQRFKLTHEFLALLLGVRRPGVTIGLQRLEQQGLVQTSRGEIMLVDRPGLERTAGGLYGVAEAEYERLFGPWPA
ncbi:MAG: Crp/Fnr family transcriptional regulator [Bosea sp. (in: a-proteobacteria)]